MKAQVEISAAPSRPHNLIGPLAVIGMAIGAYLTYVKYSGGVAVCAGIGDCELVQSSRYSEFLGIPIALLGMLAYLAILFLWKWGRNPDALLAEYVPLALFGLALVGLLYSAYLTYVEVFLLRAVCPWCVASAVDIAIIFVLTLSQALNRETSPD